MIIDNSVALALMKKDLEYFYYDAVDLKIMPNNITIIATSPDELTNHSFIRVTEYNDDTLIQINTDKSSLISEAVSVAKQKKNSKILLSLGKDMDLSFLSDTFLIEISENQDYKHWGIFGAIQNNTVITNDQDITIATPSQDDIALISSLPNNEWVFLPSRIKFVKNIIIAKKENNILGYLIYESVDTGHYDIAMVYVHPNYRRLGVAIKLIKGFANECANKNGIGYYVSAGSEASAKLAVSLNIRKVREENVIYNLK